MTANAFLFPCLSADFDRNVGRLEVLTLVSESHGQHIVVRPLQMLSHPLAETHSDALGLHYASTVMPIGLAIGSVIEVAIWRGAPPKQMLHPQLAQLEPCDP